MKTDLVVGAYEYDTTRALKRMTELVVNSPARACSTRQASGQLSRRIVGHDRYAVALLARGPKNTYLRPDTHRYGAGSPAGDALPIF